MSADIASLISDNLDVWAAAVERKSGAGRGGGKGLSFYGIERLRVLILDLAIRGKLVPQDARDEPAASRLKIARENLAFAAPGIGRLRWKPSRSFDDAETSRKLPAGWSLARVNDTGFYINGLAFKPSDWASSGRPIIRIQNLTNPDAPYNYAVGEFPDEVIVRDGDLLVSWSATLAAFQWRGEEAVLNQHIFRVIREPSLTDHAFLRLLLGHAIAEMADSDHAHGLVMAHINRGPFLDHLVAIPPLAEQRRIVAKVDELMALCDALEAQSASSAAAHQTLVKSLIATLLNRTETDSLATNWARLSACFDILFADVASVSGLKSAVVELALSGFLTGTAPFGEKPLSQLITFGPKNGYSPRAVNIDTGVKSLSLSATTKGEFDGDHYKFVDIERPEPKSELWLKNGDVLIQRANSIDYVGVSAVYEGHDNQFIYPDLMMKIRFSYEVDPKFAILCLNSNSVREYFRSRASGTSGSMPKINQTTVLSARIPVPDLSQQRRIVAKVDQLRALCDALEARIAVAAETQRHLADAIVERAAA